MVLGIFQPSLISVASNYMQIRSNNGFGQIAFTFDATEVWRLKQTGTFSELDSQPFHSRHSKWSKNGY